MAQKKIAPGEVINLFSLRDDMPEDATLALMKTSDMEAIRMVLPQGKEINEHSVDGEMSVQCLEGKTEFQIGEKVHELSVGDWLYLGRKQPHSLRAIEDSVLLVTILFIDNSSQKE